MLPQQTVIRHRSISSQLATNNSSLSMFAVDIVTRDALKAAHQRVGSVRRFAVIISIALLSTNMTTKFAFQTSIIDNSVMWETPVNRAKVCHRN